MRMTSIRMISYSYDELQRMTQKHIYSEREGGGYWEEFFYKAGSSTGTTTSLVEVKKNWKDNVNQTHYFHYTYDGNGNILTETDTTNNTSVSYTYDTQNQLLSATYGDGREEAYTYDTAGNIMTFNNGISSHTYTYGNADWRDLLTAVDGHSLTYDEIGNPLAYYNGEDYTMTWAEGRRLQSVTVDNQTTTYEYDYNGYRTKKTNADGSYIMYYIVAGRTVGEVRHAADGTITLYMRYVFDEADSVIGYSLWYAGDTDWTTCYFLKNLQGDVIQIYRGRDNALMAEYTYDSWGNVISATGELAEMNPFRYRGYYYDVETGFYYLQSRYYDAGIGRFLNADSYASTGQGEQGYNMFAYCINNPINMLDSSGEIAVSTLILIGSIVASVGVASYTAYTSHKATGEVDVGSTVMSGLSTFMFCYTYGMSAYGMYLNYCNYNGYTPVTDIGSGTNVSSQIQNSANLANSKVSGVGAKAGIQKHAIFADNINKLGNSTLRTEVSYKNGCMVSYGTKGSIRFDVMQYDQYGNPAVAWDLKTGNAILSQSRLDQMINKSGLNIPIYEVK